MRTRIKRALRPASLRARLLLMLLVATGAVWLTAAWWSYHDALQEAEELLDAQLAQSARLVLAQTRHELIEEGGGELDALDTMFDDDLHPYEQKLQFRIYSAEGKVLLSSSSPPPLLDPNMSGYLNLQDGEMGWRVLVTGDPGGLLRVEVAQSLSIRDEIASYIALRMAMPVLVALPLLAVLIYLLVGRALRPLVMLAKTVSFRGASNLSPLETDTLPREVLPVVTSLNTLLGRLGRTLENERRFTADAAHELRTPLAAIQMQAQVALATTDDKNRQHALGQVIGGTQRATRLVEQLLRLARLDPLTGLGDTHPVDLNALARQVVAELPGDADGGRVHWHAGEAASVQGDADLLAVALRNLLDNALRYTPEGSQVNLAIRRDANGLCLEVEDDGPGVPETELARLTERFYRGREVTQEGSGLGLAIVQRIAQLHGATLKLENRQQGGLRAGLCWDDKAK